MCDTLITPPEDILRHTAKSLGLRVEAGYSQLNDKQNPRYLHANVADPQRPDTRWRMKVVNPNRADLESVQDCNEYNNCVHARLAQLTGLRGIVTVPMYFSVPPTHVITTNVAELVHGRRPEINDLPRIANLLANLQGKRVRVISELERLNNLTHRSINRYNQPHYKMRLESSVRGFDGCFGNRLIAAFETRFPTSVPDEHLTFAHGDFSFGNLVLAGDSMTLIDFEHSHIGLNCIDLAHMFVNLIANGQYEAANSFREAYEHIASQHGLWFERAVFEALILERAAGKLNAMKQPEKEGRDRLQRLLLSYAS